MMPKISTMCKGMTRLWPFQKTACAFLHKHVDKTCFILAVSTVLSWGFITKFSKQKDFREVVDIHNRKQNLLNSIINRPDKEMFLALKYK